MSDPSADNPKPARRIALIRPRSSLQHSLVLWTIIWVILPTSACALWLNHIARGMLADNHVRNVTMLGQTMAAALAGYSTPHGRSAGETLQTLSLDHRIAFVILQNPDGQPLYRRTADAESFVTYMRWASQAGLDGSLDLERPVFLGQQQDLVVRKVPVWNPPLPDPRQGEGSPSRQLEGYLVLALRDPNMHQAIARLQHLQLLAAAVVCLFSVPAAVLAVRRLTAPLRRLLEAIVCLGSGRTVEEIPVQRHDELGLVAQAFNHMTRNLFSARELLQRANADLERKVQQRTAELQDLNHRLETEMQDKNEFLRAVSHDLGAPLRNIAGMATMLLLKYKNQLAEDAQAKLERISANVKVQTDLINDLLELSRLRSTSAKQESVDLAQLVQQIRENLSYDLERSCIELEVLTALPTVTAERNRLRQVFQNLLDNAVKYMLDSKDRRITVSCHDVGRMLEFEVADTGKGIAPEDLPHIFQVFHRSSHSGTHHVAGRGVGLASVKTIVEGYGGQISVTSRLGHGARFRFSLDKRRLGLLEPQPVA